MARLSATARKRLPGGAFALPGRRYPIEDASHARNALARVSQFGSPEEKARVRAAVKRKYPGIGKKKRGGKASGKKPHALADKPRRARGGAIAEGRKAEREGPISHVAGGGKERGSGDYIGASRQGGKGSGKGTGAHAGLTRAAVTEVPGQPAVHHGTRRLTESRGSV